MSSQSLGRVVEGVARRYRVSVEDYQDLIQETRIALWKRGADASVARALVAQIASNKAVDLLRLAIRSRAKTRLLGSAATRDGGELQHLLNAAASGLPPRLLAFYRLRFEQGRSEREIARILGISRGSIRWMNASCCRQILGESRQPVANVKTPTTLVPRGGHP